MGASYDFAEEIVVGSSPVSFMCMAMFVGDWFAIWNFMRNVVWRATLIITVLDRDLVLYVHKVESLPHMDLVGGVLWLTGYSKDA